MNPIFRRHLHRVVRRPRFFWLLSAYLALTALSSLLFVGFSIAGQPFLPPAQVSMLHLYRGGRTLFWATSVLLLTACTLLIPVHAIAAISAERERHTFDLLLTTGLQPRAIILGKWSAALTTGLVYLVAPLPLTLLGYWLGAVTAAEIAVTLVFLIANAVASTAWAVFLSTRCRRTVTAVLIFYGVALIPLPLIGITAVLVGGVTSSWLYTFGPTQSMGLAALIEYGWVFLTSLHPLTTAIASEVLWLEQGSWGLLAFTLSRTTLSPPPTITLPSPWIIHVVLTLGTAAAFLLLATRRVARPEH
ncbi:MAG: hypothetical protein JXB35_06655 [Anaerolineae bacterium]|nr:hypothetical protein [Anaerolineae bacterium]